MKTCTKCSETKPVAEFSKNAVKRDGLCVRCKSCAKKSFDAWRTANIDKDKARCAAYFPAYYAANRQKLIEYQTAYRESNPDKVRARQADWYTANRESRIAAACEWQKANREARRVISQNRRSAKGKLSKGLAEKLFKLQRGKCACGCKQPLGTDFHLDHRMPLALGGANEDWNIQLLRSTCNQQKHAKDPIEFMRQRGFLL